MATSVVVTLAKVGRNNTFAFPLLICFDLALEPEQVNHYVSCPPACHARVQDVVHERRMEKLEQLRQKLGKRVRFIRDPPSQAARRPYVPQRKGMASFVKIHLRHCFYSRHTSAFRSQRRL